MLEWIASVARDLEKANKRGKLVSGVCLSACIRRIGFDRPPITPELALLILRMLTFSVDKEKSCPDYTYLCEILPQHYRLLTAGNERCHSLWEHGSAQLLCLFIVVNILKILSTCVLHLERSLQVG